jgi:hypothetical protein
LIGAVLNFIPFVVSGARAIDPIDDKLVISLLEQPTDVTTPSSDPLSAYHDLQCDTQFHCTKEQSSVIDRYGSGYTNLRDATHFLMRRVCARLPPADPLSLRKSAIVAQTCLIVHVLAYNLTRVMNIMGIQPLMAAIRA